LKNNLIWFKKKLLSVFKSMKNSKIIFNIKLIIWNEVDIDVNLFLR